MMVYGRRLCVCSLLLLGALLVAASGSFAASPRARESIVGGASTSIARFPFQVALYNPHAGRRRSGSSAAA